MCYRRYLEQVLITTQCSYQYSDENFDLNREDSLNVLYHHIYSKEYKKRVKVRKEVQEYPKKPLEEEFKDKFKYVDDNGDKTFTIGL
jgi:hypothetical protein